MDRLSGTGVSSGNVATGACACSRCCAGSARITARTTTARAGVECGAHFISTTPTAARGISTATTAACPACAIVSQRDAVTATACRAPLWRRRGCTASFRAPSASPSVSMPPWRPMSQWLPKAWHPWRPMSQWLQSSRFPSVLSAVGVRKRSRASYPPLASGSTFPGRPIRRWLQQARSPRCAIRRWLQQARFPGVLSAVGCHGKHVLGRLSAVGFRNHVSRGVLSAVGCRKHVSRGVLSAVGFSKHVSRGVCSTDGFSKHSSRASDPPFAAGDEAGGTSATVEGILDCRGAHGWGAVAVKAPGRSRPASGAWHKRA